jgi:myosin tail region-interacting protein MTI1
MSDEQPTPQKKVGSLRDRIAAFEKQSTAQPAPPPPVPRAKPAGISWKPKQPSPPSSPSHNDVEQVTNIVPGSRTGGMSAADARESIGQGGSLKERMAALQGKGAFGAPPPPTVPPKPATEKPKWKPPQPISSSSPLIEADQQDPDSESVHAEAPQLSEAVESTDKAETKLEDPEEEERLRRAAITARLQRLGGSKIGMGPPILGAKPAVKKPIIPKEEELKTVDQGPGALVHIFSMDHFTNIICIDLPTQSSPNPLQEGELRPSSEAGTYLFRFCS